MAVQDAAHGVRNRFIMIVAFHQHGEQAGDGPGTFMQTRTGAFQQPRQFGEDGGGVTLAGGRLAGRQADLALGHGEAGHRIHQQQDIEAIVAQLLGHRHGDIGRLAAHQRRFVAGRGDHDGAGQAALAQIVLDELLHFAATFADQADHDGVGVGVARQHGQQRGFAHARAGEDAHALTGAQGGEGVHGAHAHVELAADAGAARRQRRRRLQRIRLCSLGQGSGPSGMTRARPSRKPTTSQEIVLLCPTLR